MGEVVCFVVDIVTNIAVCFDFVVGVVDVVVVVVDIVDVVDMMVVVVDVYDIVIWTDDEMYFGFTNSQIK